MKRDLLLLAAFYDRATQAPFLDRWKKLSGRLRYGVTLARWPDLLGWGGSALTFFIAARLLYGDSARFLKWWFWLLVAILLGGSWFMKLRRMWRMGALARRITRDVAVVPRHQQELRAALSSMWESAIQDQPLPVTGPADARYQLLNKFQAILRELGFQGVVVLMDRVDEPQLINGSPEAMRDFVWPLLDNKLLRQPGLAFKLLLPIELSHYLPKESKEFYDRSRLDKQNTVRSLEWSGQALYDMAGERLSATLPEAEQKTGKRLSLRDLISDDMSTQQIVHAFDYLRVPRHLFKFLYRLITEHCNSYTSDEPEWKIQPGTFQATLKLYLRDLEAFDKGYGHG